MTISVLVTIVFHESSTVFLRNIWNEGRNKMMQKDTEAASTVLWEPGPIIL